tara:strand:+ start:9543 stop:9851 length:309 start_codon:yes stop_codon:yes gene_type:complete
MRKCKNCGLEKPLNEFANAGIVKGVKYWRHLCIPCYSESKQPRKRRQRELFQELKQRYSCERCGNDDFRVLDFDHLDPKQKSYNVSEMVDYGFFNRKDKRGN